SFQYRVTQPDRFDLALLRLSRPVLYRENVLPICLPHQSDIFKGQTGVVAGWGKTDTTYGKTGTNILQKATVPILSDEECLQWHDHKNINLELFSEMFCAGHSDGHMDACLKYLETAGLVTWVAAHPWMSDGPACPEGNASFGPPETLCPGFGRRAACLQEPR
ncbi:unnamed protein product, partial [Timema podura]|nr:unnamed protein product [Timema podura]